jgi:hypothetical protein
MNKVEFVEVGKHALVLCIGGDVYNMESKENPVTILYMKM